jgi:8-oxo-dGTP pyrophosphatase MutT (NUDIX family)
MIRNRLGLYLSSFGPPICEEMITWGDQLLRVRSYIGYGVPPADYVTSVRCVVLCGNQVLVVRDPQEQHILPGGRRAPGETFEQTARREVREETGWLLGELQPLGVKHFYHLSPKSANYPYPYPDFLQLIYQGYALTFDAQAKEPDGYELAASLQLITNATLRTLRPSDRHFLRAARRFSEAQGHFYQR